MLDSDGLVSMNDQMLNSDCDRTCRACVRSLVMYADMVAFELGMKLEKDQMLACVRSYWIERV